MGEEKDGLGEERGGVGKAKGGVGGRGGGCGPSLQDAAADRSIVQTGEGGGGEGWSESGRQCR